MNAPSPGENAATEGREGMVTVYDHAGEYVGCMGAEMWAWLLAHPDLDASALAALLAQAEAGAHPDAWSERAFEQQKARAVAAEARVTELERELDRIEPRYAAAMRVVALIRVAHDRHLTTGDYMPLGMVAQDALREFDAALASVPPAGDSGNTKEGR